jgi:adenylate cyclase
MTASPSERRLAAILSADVAGYSRLMGADEAGTLKRLTEHRTQLIEPTIAAHRGRVVKLMGDGLLAEFGSAIDALTCAIAIQRGMAERTAGVPESARIAFRIGINVGDVIVEGDDIFGDGVNVAARLQALAQPGSVYVSGDVARYVTGRIDEALESLGPQSLKNIAQPIPVWRWQAAPAPAAASAPGAKPSVAILPFANMSADPEQEYFADGITEDIITDLSKIAGLLVISRNSAFTYKGRAVRIEEICRELGVRYAVEGSVRRAANRVRITAQLIDGLSGGHLWAERYDRQLDDIFAVQDDVTRNIVDALKVKLSAGEQSRLGTQETANLEAYDLVLKGREMARRYTRQAQLEAIALFDRALALEPNYARALAVLASTYARSWTLGWSDSVEETLGRAIELTGRALALDENQPEAHAVRGFSLCWMRRYDEALATTERGVLLGPNDALVHLYRAVVLAHAGQPAAAIPEAKAGLALDPKQPTVFLWALGHAYFLLEDHGAARVELEKAIEANPNFFPPHLFLAAVYVALGLMDLAKARLEQARAVNASMVTHRWIKERLPYRDPSVNERLIALLRQVGVTA